MVIKASLFSAKSGAFVLDEGRRFKKEILYEGSFRHPSTGRKHTFARSDLEKMARNSNALLADEGVSIPFPDGHKFDALDNLGFWSEFTVEPSTSREGVMGLFAIATVPTDEYAARMGKTITEVSVLVESGVKLTTGKIHPGPVITHCCATNYPVIPNQANFVASLSRVGDGGDGDTVEAEITAFAFATERSEEPMDQLLKLIALSFGLSVAKDGDPSATPEGIVTAAAEAFSTMKARVKTLEEENALLSKRPPAADEADPRSPREIELEAKLAVVEKERTKTFIEAAMATGKISKAEADFLSVVATAGQCEKEDSEGKPQVVTGLSLVESYIGDRKEGESFSAKPSSVRGTSLGEAKTVLERKEADAAYLEKRGHKITWNADRTDYTVAKSAN